MSGKTTYTTELGDKICQRLASGESLITICDTEGMPSKSTVLLWVVKGDRGEEPYVSFSDQYAHAREAQAESIMDEVVYISDGSGDVNRDRLRVDTRLKAMARMHPKKYSERLDQTITSSHTFNPEANAARIGELLQQAGLTFPGGAAGANEKARAAGEVEKPE